MDVEQGRVSEYDALSKEELIALAMQLREALAWRDEQIALLSAQLERLRTGGGGATRPHIVKPSKKSR